MERLVKLELQDLLEVKAVLENVVKKVTREMLVLVYLQDLLEARGEKCEKEDAGGIDP